MHVWIWIVLAGVYSCSAVSVSVDESAGCPACAGAGAAGAGAGAQCRYVGAVRDECYYRVRGARLTAQARGRYYRLACDGTPLDDSALPRLGAPRRAPAVVIDGCALPATSVGVALAALNVSVLDELVLTRIPASGELHDNLLSALEVQRLTLAARAGVGGRPLRAPRGLLRPLTRLTQLQLSDITLDAHALLTLPHSLESLHLTRCNLTSIPAAALERLPRLWRLIVDEPQLRESPLLPRAPTLTALILSAPLPDAPPLYTLINATLSGVLDVRLPGGCGRIQRLSVLGGAVTSLPPRWLQRDGGAHCPALLELRVQRVPALRFIDPTALAGASSLTLLALTDCPLLTALPDDLLLPLRALHTLQLSRNSLTHISDGLLAPLTALRHLDLSSNQLMAAAAHALGALTPLTHLFLDHNPLGDLCPGSEGADSLQVTNSLSPLSPLTSLRVLSLSDTGQQRVCGDWRRQLGRLETLRLRNNDILMLGDDDYRWRREGGSGTVTVQLQGNPCRVALSQRGYSALALRRDTARHTSATLQLAVTTQCDCRHYWLARALQEDVLPAQLSGVQCRRPGGGSVPLERAQLDLMVCEEHSQCPVGCECSWRPHDDTVRAQCSGSSALTAFGDVRVRAARLELAACCNVSALPAAGALPAATRRLLLAHNALQSVGAQLGALAARNVTLRLQHNALHCDCTELTALHRYRDKIEDFENVTCSDGSPVWLMLPAAQCAGTSGLGALGALGGAAVLAGALAAAVRRRIQRTVKHILFRRRNKLHREKHYLYDGFLAFSYRDAEFAEQLMLALERKGGGGGREGEGDEGGLRLCVHTRDWAAGCWLPRAVQHAVRHSRRTVALLSRAFDRGVWTRAELRHAAARHSAGLGLRPVVIVLERAVPRALRPYARAAHCLRRDDPRLLPALRRLLAPQAPHNIL